MKKIFTYIDASLIITGLISILGLVINIKGKNFNFLKHIIFMLILFPTLLLTTIMINFDATFVTFHKMLFRNNYWQFDPELDPIIQILPEEFFYHTALLIAAIIIFSIIAFILIHKRLIRKKLI